MKRVLLFLLVFGLGLATLWYFRGARPGPKDATEVQAPAPEGEFTEVSLAGKNGQPGKAIGAVLDGPLSMTLRGGTGPVQHPKLELRAADVDSLGGDLYDLKDVQVEVLDPDRGTKRAQLQSPLARTTLVIDAVTAGGSELKSVRFTDIDATLFEGTPVVPLRFRSSSVDMDVPRLGFTTTERVTVEGQGLEAEGAGLRAGFGEERVVLDRDGRVRLTLEGGERAILTSGKEGSLVVERIERDGVSTVEVTAKEGARLAIEGGERTAQIGEITIDARTIHLVGRGPTAERKNYELVSADAQGDVVAHSAGDEFRAQRADFVFGDRGRLRLATLEADVVLVRSGDTFHARTAVFEFGDRGVLSKATLTGDPTGDVGIGRFLDIQRPQLTDGRAAIAGAGPLVVRVDDGIVLELTGPATVKVPLAELTVEATQRIEGKVRKDQRGGELHAIGDVRVDYQGKTLRSPSLDLFWKLQADSALTVDAASSGSTSLRGVTEDGRPVALDATGGLEARWLGTKLLVPAAQGVSFAVGAEGAPDRVQATAQRVTALDWEARTFTAEGDVTFRGVDGDGDAARVVVRGERDVELFGDDSKRASYRLRRSSPDPDQDLRAETRAREIRATERRVVAKGDVHVDAEVTTARLDLDAQEVEVEVAPERKGSLDPRPFHVEARRDVRAHIVRGDEVADLDAQWTRIDGRLEPRPGAEPPLEVFLKNVEARGEVHAVYAGPDGRGALDARADRFTVDETGKGRLSAGAGRRVTASGTLPGALAAYTISADWIDFDPDSMRASRVEGGLVDRESAKASKALLRDMRADSVEADREHVLLQGNAHIAGASEQDEDWSLDANSIRVQGDFSDPGAIDAKRVKNLLAQGGFEARMGSRGTARGEKLEGVPGRVRFEGRPAELALMDAEWRAPWIEYDMANMLLATDKGEITSRPGADGTSWSLSYDSMQPFDQGDTTILVLRNPRLRYGSTQLFADWTLFWVDRDEWQRSGKRAIKETAGEPDLLVRSTGDPARRGDEDRPPPNKWQAQLEQIRKSPIFRLLSEVYIEGNVEIYQVGDRSARAGALYFDLVEEHGWIQDADVVVDLEMRGLPRSVRAKAEWMRISAGPTLRADTAVLTACDFDEPHYVIETTDLRLTPQVNDVDDRVAFQVTAEGNAIRFEDGLRLPMPPLVYETDAEGNPLVDRLVLGNSAKFGAAIGASINTQLGGIGLTVGKLAKVAFGLPDIPIKGGWNFDVRYLGSRGLLLGAGLDLRLGDKLDFNAQIDGIPDRRDDSGLVRVDRDDRSLLRTWLHSRGRYWLERGDDAEWVDLALSYQSDPGVQSEFFERDYLAYEQKDNYLHWRKANGADYFSGKAKILLEDRTDTAELPSLGAMRGRTKIDTWWENPVYYTGTLDAAYLKRQDGDPRYYEPFPDGLGDREVLRADTKQRVEMPFPLGVLNANVTPYVEGRGTIWSQGVDESTSPARAALLAGIEATTTLWRRSSGGTAHTLSPRIGIRGDIADVETDATPVRFDTTEDPYLGTFLDVGARAHWWKPDTTDRLDIDVQASLGEGVEGPQPDGLQPIAFLGGYFTILGGFPFAITQDGRYDVRENETQYSASAMGFEPVRNVGIELGHSYGRDALDDTLYEAASIRARWRWTTKWEMEATQTQSLLERRSLGSEFVLRRLGHDFVVEIELGYRAGEGTRFGFGFEPRLSWSRSSLGLIDQWLGIFH
ncbi:MAG: hypothetical protein NTY35_06475 [Planctomycetota bacterium]|nr:hypothetical protein [Planctomycetota bacterium]